MNSHHAFFNFISSSRKFRIPAPFALETRGVLGDRVILRDVYENSWEMEVVIDGEYEYCYFSEGWRQFYIENSLEVGDLMVFEYRANKLFDFQIFGSNACQKKGVGALKANTHHAVKQEYYDDGDDDGIHDDVGAPKLIEHKVVKEEYDDASMDVDDGDDDDDVIRDVGDDVIHDDSDDDDDYVPEEGEEEEEELVNTNLEKAAKLKNKSKPAYPPCAPNTCEGHMHMDEDASDEDDVEQLRTTSKTINAKSKSKSKSSTNSTRGNTSGNGNIPCERIFKKKDLPDCYGADIFRSGLASVPKNPYFVSRSRVARRKNELYIPKDVIVDYGLKISGTMFLVDERGNKWKSKMIKWKDGRLWCTKGWRNLCNVNGINLDDTCICEFVREEGCEEYSLLVTVVGGGLDK
ncbi:PREDICTED: putative B3 domain-containing protein At5g66980 [Erythranthe guttata]|nr:PREDICTED: putative B3 domain-containing protein At5g66980 [Erythranthe guttata]|eukprot:XP_012838181.1 PREDICTED: putative B3 domain-containing protein At5g66980 [Erythranthe guttata]